MSDSSFEQRLAQAKDHLEKLKGTRKDVVDPAAWTPSLPKVAFKLAVYRDALLWRFTELAGATLSEVEAGRLVAANVMVRSSLETATAMFYADSISRRACETDNPKGVDELLMRLLLGTRWTDWEHQAVNVLSMLKSLNKELPGALKIYDELSEMAHPNWPGTVGAYSKPDKGNVRTHLGEHIRARDDNADSALHTLNICIIQTAFYYDRITEFLPAFSIFCRKYFGKQDP